jgi:hypothetical protein
MKYLQIFPVFYIDLDPVSSYNTRMRYSEKIITDLPPRRGGFFRPDHDPLHSPGLQTVINL